MKKFSFPAFNRSKGPAITVADRGNAKPAKSNDDSNDKTAGPPANSKPASAVSVESILLQGHGQGDDHTDQQSKAGQNPSAETAPQKSAVKKVVEVFEGVADKFEGVADKVVQELARGANTSIINLVGSIIELAYGLRASDIHFDPQGDKVRVRLRIDGVLQDTHALPKKIHSEVIMRIKILAGLRTDEHQAAQDGRFRYNHKEAGQAIDIRVSIAPTYHGENAVLRLLSDQSTEFTLEALGFSAENRKKLIAALKRPYGMILATGPTGSGKTTTLYTLITMLNTQDVSIVTIEDPIEYAIEGIEQIQVNARTQLTFANGLRSILRQDPNIIMVGEIRDAETAGIAVNTALTGHLVLSTLHTNDAATTLPRLLDMKIESYLIASTVNVAIGQRLVRKICEDCKTGKEITAAELKSLSEVVPAELLRSKKTFYYGTGCNSCNNSGYRGRIGIHEVLVPDPAIREAVLKRAPAGEIRQLAIDHGMITMVHDGFLKAQKGITTIEEVLRTMYE